MKRQLFTLLITLFTVSSLMAQSWSELLSPDLKKGLNDLNMVSETEFWAVADDGLLYHTEDGFESVEEILFDEDVDLAKVFFIDENKGWIGTEGGYIMLTTDGGEDWEEVSFDTLMPSGFTFKYFDGIYFVNDQVGFALAGKYKYNYLFKTTDGGLTWAVKDSLTDGTSQRWNDIKFANDTLGIIAGEDAGSVRYTIDAGETWTVADSAISSAFSDGLVFWLSENEVIYLGQGNEFFLAPMTYFKSTDGGKTWENDTASVKGIYDRPKGVYFKDALNGIAVGDNGFAKMFIMKTNDGGNSWTTSLGDFSLGLKSLLGNGDLLYAIGSSGHIVKSTDFGDTWEVIPLNSPTSFSAIEFAGDKGFVLNSYSDLLISDAVGMNWEISGSIGLWNARAMFFLDDMTGFIVKENRSILKTTDGGSSWQYVLEPLEFSTRNKVGGISFGDNQTGYALFSVDDYADYRVYKTTDAGDTWTEVAQIEGPSSFSGGIEFFDENKGFIAGPRVKPDTVYVSWIKYTEDGGATWNDAIVDSVTALLDAQSFRDVAMIDESSAIAIGGENIFITNDYGKNWTLAEFNFTVNDSNFYRIDFNGDNGIITTYDGEIIVTTDGGDTWDVNQEYYDVLTPSALCINDYGNIYFGTNDGYIYGLVDPTDVEYNEIIVNNYRLEQNYPNPFNPTTTINFVLPENGMVNLSIYNILGQKVATIVNKELKAGSYKYNFDASNLSSGMYIYQMETGAYTFSRKMMLLK